VIAISNSGGLPELLAAVDAARASGADVIAITHSQSELARRASVVLPVDHPEDSTHFLAMISRILQLLLIDIMTVGVSLDTHQLRTIADAVGGDGELEVRRTLISHLDN